MNRPAIPLFVLIFSLVGRGHAQSPTIAAITNAAQPSLSGANPTFLAPNSIGTLWGTNLSAPDGTNSNSSLHFLVLSGPCAESCDIEFPVLYVSPTQINFYVPAIKQIQIGPSGFTTAGNELWGRAELIRDGIPYLFGCADSSCTLKCWNGTTLNCPGNFGISAGAGFIPFQIGFDCLFSSGATLDQCGPRASPPNLINLVTLSAITDADGSPISSTNPVVQGQIITLWGTGGFPEIQATQPLPQFAFGVPYSATNNVFLSLTYRILQPALWVGSVHPPGLEQVNITVPTCRNKPLSATVKHVDAFFGIHNIQLYLPLLIQAGDPDCSI